jgi:hypothetical protein
MKTRQPFAWECKKCRRKMTSLRSRTFLGYFISHGFYTARLFGRGCRKGPSQNSYSGLAITRWHGF